MVGCHETSCRDRFNKEQRAFYANRAPEGLELDELTVLGPITVFKLKFTHKGLDRPMVAELWTFPNGSRILELSSKCRPTEAFQAAVQARAFLTGKEIDLSAEQETETMTALKFFAKEARTANGAGS